MLLWIVGCGLHKQLQMDMWKIDDSFSLNASSPPLSVVNVSKLKALSRRIAFLFYAN